MSRFFRPDPTTVGKEVIEKERQRLIDWNWQVTSSFAHIVLDDYNLGDRSILFCLQQDRITKWVDREILDTYEKPIPDPSVLEEWERYWYDDIMEMRDEIIIFLRWLLHTSEDERSQVTDL